MDLQTRKLNAIGYLINLEDERILNKIEAAIFETSQINALKHKPFTKKQLVERAKKANQDNANQQQQYEYQQGVKRQQTANLNSVPTLQNAINANNGLNANAGL